MGILIKREVYYFYLKKPLIIFLTLILVLFITPSLFYPLYSLPNDSSPLISVFHKLIPAILIILLGMQSVGTQFYAEKINRNIEVLLALGYEPIRIWLCKVISIAIVVYSLYLIGLLFSFMILSYISSKIIPIKGAASFINLLFFSPLLGLSALGLNGVLQLILDDIRILNVLVIIFSFIFLFFLPQILKIIPLTEILQYFPLLSLLASGFLILILFLILKKTPTEKYLQ